MGYITYEIFGRISNGVKWEASELIEGFVLIKTVQVCENKIPQNEETTRKRRFDKEF